MRVVLLVACVITSWLYASQLTSLPQDLCDEENDSCVKTQAQEQKIAKKHALALGVSILSGDGVLLEKDAALNVTKKTHAKDGNITGLLGGVYRITPRHTLRYDLHAGFSSISFSGAQEPGLFELSGAKVGVGLGYEWGFYLGDRFSWSLAISAEYTTYYYKQDKTLLLLQEAMPKVGIGFEGRGHHYFEVFFGVPVYANLKVKNDSTSFIVSNYPRHLRLGFLYAYRF